MRRSRPQGDKALGTRTKRRTKAGLDSILRRPFYKGMVAVDDVARKEIPIVSVDKGTFEFIDADGNHYVEVDSDIWVRSGHVIDGAIGYHGSGSHGGHVVLKPFYRFSNGTWSRLYGLSCVR